MAHLTARKSGTLNTRLVCLAPAWATTTSKRSCLSGSWCTHGRQFDAEKRSQPCLAPALLYHGTSCLFVLTSLPRCACSLRTLRRCWICASSRASWYKCCGPLTASCFLLCPPQLLEPVLCPPQLLEPAPSLPH